MKQLQIFNKKPNKIKGRHFFRLDFGIYSRYSESFEFKKIPSLEAQKIMIQIFFKNKEVAELKVKYGLTGFELEKE